MVSEMRWNGAGTGEMLINLNATKEIGAGSMLYRLLGKIGLTSHFHFDFILLLLFSIDEAIQWISILIAHQNLLFQITK